MDNINSFKEIFESVPDYRKIVIIIFLIKNDRNLLKEIGFSKSDIIRLFLEFQKFLLGEHEDDLDFIKDQEESILEKFLNK